MTAKQKIKVLRREIRNLKKEYREEYDFLKDTADQFDLDYDPVLRRMMVRIDEKKHEIELCT